MVFIRGAAPLRGTRATHLCRSCQRRTPFAPHDWRRAGGGGLGRGIVNGEQSQTAQHAIASQAPQHTHTRPGPLSPPCISESRRRIFHRRSIHGRVRALALQHTMAKRKGAPEEEAVAAGSPSSSSSSSSSSGAAASSGRRGSSGAGVSSSAAAAGAGVGAALRPPLKLRRLALLDELEDAWTSAATKAARGKPRDQQAQLAAVFEGMKKQVIGTLRANAVADDELGAWETGGEAPLFLPLPPFLTHSPFPGVPQTWSPSTATLHGGWTGSRRRRRAWARRSRTPARR
jgi:hypothetical protein